MSKYCDQCGCYIPDEWDKCPSCHTISKKPHIAIVGHGRPPSALAQSILLGERIPPIKTIYDSILGNASIERILSEIEVKTDNLQELVSYIEDNSRR